MQVTDISSPHHASQDAEVLKVLTDLGIQDRPRLHVLNKTDLVSKEELEILKKIQRPPRPGKILFPQSPARALQDLLARIDAAMPVDQLVRVNLRIPISDGRHLSLVHACGRVLHSEMEDGHFSIEAELPESFARRLEEFVPVPPRTGDRPARVRS